MNLIIEFQYFPSVILYRSLNKVSDIVFEQYERYQKMSFRNRCRIAGADGWIDLSIPLERGRDQRAMTKEVRISSPAGWQSAHWKTICSCYSRSPWFEQYQDDLAHLYQTHVSYLRDWDLACFEWTLRVLKMAPKISFSDGYRNEYSGEDWIDLRDRIRPGDLPFGDAPIRYRQVFEERTGFLPGLSILDLLFCEGPRARMILAGEDRA